MLLQFPCSACFKKLPKILCFNTMRYTFNMVTMMKEKVNTHFSFPLRLDMSQYLESHLMGPDKLKGLSFFSGVILLARVGTILQVVNWVHFDAKKLNM